MVPQLKLSGSPRPRNDSVVSERMAMATTSTRLAKMSGITLGRTCLRMMCQLLEPMARALDELELAHAQRVGADHAGRARPAREPDDEDDGHVAGAKQQG